MRIIGGILTPAHGTPHIRMKTFGLEQQDVIQEIKNQRPIFLSHKHEDSELVSQLRDEMSRHGVPTYMDIYDPMVEGDSAELVNHIRAVIKHCHGLLAYTAPKAQLSWWIPLEIAFAMEAKSQLATYIKNVQPNSLPSYLWNWPVVDHDTEATTWGAAVRRNPSSVTMQWSTSERRRTKSMTRMMQF